MNFDACRNEREPVEAVLAAKNALALRLLTKRMMSGDMADYSAAAAAWPWLWQRADFDACLEGVYGSDDEGKQEMERLWAAIAEATGTEP